MTAGKKFKRRVRDRMAQTGETYCQARSAILKVARFEDSMNKCRCGNPLPNVADDETPYEFCSSVCAEVARGLHG